MQYRLQWPLQLAISPAALESHEQIFELLLQLRRARWALETLESVPTGTADAPTAAPAQPASERRDGQRGPWRWCAHPWRVLRAEILHVIAAIYAHLTLGVINPEWQAFEAAMQNDLATSVDTFRSAHEAFAKRVAERCLLAPPDAPVRHAIEAILGLALRLRMQLRDLPRLNVRVHATSAAKWRQELRRAVVFVLGQLRLAASRDARTELLDLCRLLDFNGFYHNQGGTI